MVESARAWYVTIPGLPYYIDLLYSLIVMNLSDFMIFLRNDPRNSE